ncbi:unnamed protein product [Rotaria sordida]|uniref:CCHC-type domain-containing protein n=1 Tax=Rotaria sordida TaxID=392033 RepID=A0A819Y0H2_9BILA|nr:unnamed protein product [Rotaria sordida]CAF1428376.1 unnamed protein product [Rotaria sordida]CAF4144927.1 unnamed protein product [Rotaria sordida]CAF4148687.1 unnamed protein product [Rotaria sordida]
MKIKSTRSTTDFTQTDINSLLLLTKNEKQPLLMMSNSEQLNIDSTQTTIDLNKNDKTRSLGHDLDDQRSAENDQKYQSSLQQQLNSIHKFDGHGNPKIWLKHIIEKFDLLQLTTLERNELVSEILTGDALIWYIEQQEHMTTFITFMKQFLQYFGNQELKTEPSTEMISSCTTSKQLGDAHSQDTVTNCLRTQLLITNLEKLQKYSGKLQQNVSEWLKQIQQTMNMFKLTDDEKLFYVPLCLEDYAQDWFYDNKHLMLTWTIFTQKLLKTFESSAKAEIAFNHLRHYEQSINQDVRQYYFDIMKLCKEANLLMDDASKLQYLKDGLKPSLRFHVLLKNPQTTTEFLEYAQKIEELKALDEKQDTQSSSFRRPSYNNSYYNTNYNSNNSSERHVAAITTQRQYCNSIPKLSYQCYKCGANDHYIRDCPHFQ